MSQKCYLPKRTGLRELLCYRVWFLAILNVYKTLYGARFALLFTDFVCVSHFPIRRKSDSKICVIFSWPNTILKLWGTTGIIVI